LIGGFCNARSGDMIDFFFLIPIAIGLGLAGLASFMRTLKNDLEGAAERILLRAMRGPWSTNSIPTPPLRHRAADPRAGQDCASSPHLHGFRRSND
jgi:cbb3-type cytochrome oxidase maturation protein